MTEQFDVIVVGAGAAGMMSAIEAGKRGRKVLLVDHAKKIGEKIEYQVVDDVILPTYILILVSLFQIILNL